MTTTAGCSSVADAVEMSLDHVIRNGPGASMDNQNRISRQEKSSLRDQSSIVGVFG
jgi:hypothetical protein